MPIDMMNIVGNHVLFFILVKVPKPKRFNMEPSAREGPPAAARERPRAVEPSLAARTRVDGVWGPRESAREHILRGERESIGVLILMHSCSELIQLPSDCHERILHKCTMSTIQSLCCTCSKWNEIVGCASPHDHRLWTICVTLQKSAPAFAGNCVQPTHPISLYSMHLPILPNVPPCLHHLIPEECAHLHLSLIHI